MSVGLVESKLLRPRLPSGVVPRPRVTAALERAAEHAVVLVSAPAGYGKTVAVASWLAERPAGWVSLDAADDDPVRLWTYAAAALGVPLGDGPLEAAIDRLAARGLPLVLEDVHVLRDPACLATLEHATRVFERLVLITRTDPSLSLGRLRAHGALGEVRARGARLHRRGGRAGARRRRRRATRSSPAPRAGPPPCTSCACGCAGAATPTGCRRSTCRSTSPPRCSPA